MKPKKQVPHMIELLPAIYQGNAGPADSEIPPFLFHYLLPFQKILLGWEDDNSADASGPTDALGPEGWEHRRAARGIRSLDTQIETFSTLLDPEKTPEAFLPWLSDWVALNVHAPISEVKKRQLISRFISLNWIRGTRKYLEEILPFFVDAGISILEDQSPESQLGVHSTLDHDFQLGGGPAHAFRVVLHFAAAIGEELERQCRAAHYVITMSKPAHTTYELEVISPSFQIGIHSTVGRDTVLG